MKEVREMYGFQREDSSNEIESKMTERRKKKCNNRKEKEDRHAYVQIRGEYSY